MMQNKILTVSIAAYQVEQCLEKTVTSMLLPEVMDDIEILIINDGSTDGTAEIGRRFQTEYPGTVRLICQENGGHGAAVERGIQEATGIYFKTVDGDDWVDAAGFLALVEYLKKDDRIDIISTPYDWVAHQTGKPMKRIAEQFDDVKFGKIYSFTEISDKIYVNMHAMTYRTKLIQEYMPPLDHHCFYVDAEYVLLPIPYIQSIAFLEKPVYQYRLGTDGQSMNLRSMQKNYTHHEKVLARILEAYGTQKDLATMVWKRGSRDEVDRQAALCRYLAKGAAKLAASQIKIYLSMPPSVKSKAKIQMLESRLRREYPEVYEMNQNFAVQILRKSQYRLYRLASFAVRRKLT